MPLPELSSRRGKVRRNKLFCHRDSRARTMSLPVGGASKSATSSIAGVGRRKFVRGVGHRRTSAVQKRSRVPNKPPLRCRRFLPRQVQSSRKTSERSFISPKATWATWFRKAATLILGSSPTIIPIAFSASSSFGEICHGWQTNRPFFSTTLITYKRHGAAPPMSVQKVKREREGILAIFAIMTPGGRSRRRGASRL